MRQVSMDANIEYLLTFLEDELRDLSDIRIHPVAPTGTQKAPDLPQDYDPEESNVHITRGVRVRAGSREFFFPVTWILDGQFDQVKNQAQEIRDYWID
jgi:hypothetical protein